MHHILSHNKEDSNDLCVELIVILTRLTSQITTSSDPSPLQTGESAAFSFRLEQKPSLFFWLNGSGRRWTVEGVVLQVALLTQCWSLLSRWPTCRLSPGGTVVTVDEKHLIFSLFCGSTMWLFENSSSLITHAEWQQCSVWIRSLKFQNNPFTPLLVLFGSFFLFFGSLNFYNLSQRRTIQTFPERFSIFEHSAFAFFNVKRKKSLLFFNFWPFYRLSDSKGGGWGVGGGLKMLKYWLWSNYPPPLIDPLREIIGIPLVIV